MQDWTVQDWMAKVEASARDGVSGTPERSFPEEISKAWLYGYGNAAFPPKYGG